VKSIVPYLRHILDAVAAIEEYTQEGKEAFLSDRKTQDAVMRNLEVIGEAAKNIPAEFRAAHAEVPWREAAALRDVLIHKYFGVDLQIVWEVVAKNLPPLKEKIAQALEAISQGG
jgi:uncharacterized protein with HEPN domain